MRGETRGTVRDHSERQHDRRHRAQTRGRRRPRRALLGRRTEPDEEEPEAERGRERQADPGCDRERPPPGSRETSTTPMSASRIPTHCTAAGERPRTRSTASGDHGGQRRDRRHDPHRSDGQAAIEASEPDHPASPAPSAPSSVATPGRPEPLAATHTIRPARPISCDQQRTASTAARRDANPPRKSPVPQSADAHSASTTAVTNQSSPTGRVAA